MNNLVRAARSQLGVKYRHQGRAPGVALDCVGLLVYACSESGVRIIDHQHYPATPYGGKLERAMDEQPALARVYGEPAEGDVVLFSWNKKDCQHIGIITDNNGAPGIIHTYSKIGKVTETGYRGYLRSLTQRVYRVIQ